MTKDEWDDTVDAIKLLSDLDQAQFRKRVEKLARELEREDRTARTGTAPPASRDAPRRGPWL